MIAEGPLPTTMAHSSCSSWALTGGFFSNGLPAASFLLALARICQALLQAQGVLHLLVRKSDEDAVLRCNLCDHPLPLHAAITRDSRSEFLDGHLQSEKDGGFILVENGDNAPAVDDGDPFIEHVGHVAGFAVDCPDACRGNLICEGLLLLLACKLLLCEIGPVCAAVMIGRWTDVQRV
jgi:hypothetical protein